MRLLLWGVLLPWAVAEGSGISEFIQATYWIGTRTLPREKYWAALETMGQTILVLTKEHS